MVLVVEVMSPSHCHIPSNKSEQVVNSFMKKLEPPIRHMGQQMSHHKLNAMAIIT